MAGEESNRRIRSQDPSLVHPPWGVIADDLTGATDVAAAFARRGFRSVVILNRRVRPPPDAEIVVLTTDSRALKIRAAGRRVHEAFGWLSRHRLPLLYKKVDSTMKGNVVAEVTLLAAIAQRARIIFSPANPAQGRTVRQGVLSVGGEVWTDLAAEFDAHGNRPVVVEAGSSRRSSGGRWPALGIIIGDATRPQALRRLSRLALADRVAPLLAGSAGLAAALAQELARGRRPRRLTREWTGPAAPGRGVMLFVGSRNPVTAGQVRRLRRERRTAAWSRRRHHLALDAFVSGDCCLVPLPVHRRPDRFIRQRLETLRTAFRPGHPGAWLATGGDTARLVCRWLRLDALIVEGEIVPGLAWGRGIGGLADGWPFATKPGGFGRELDLVRAVRFLRRG